jgi:hypothetical protein
MTTKAQLGILTEQVSNNTLKESTQSGDSASFAALILPLIEKIYTESLIAQVADTQPLKGPTGRVAALYSTYGGTGNSAETNTHPDSSYILVLTGNASGWAIDGAPITFSGDSYITRYVETEVINSTTISRVLVSRETFTGAAPVKGSTFNALVVRFATLNRAAIKKLFKDYSGSYAYGYDTNTAVKKIGFEVRTNMIETVARKVKSKFSAEQIQDLLAIYKENGVEVASEYIGNEIRHEIDKEFIEYMKFIAKASLVDPIALSASVAAAASGALQDVTSDIVANIFIAAEQIVRDTRRNRTIFVLVDPMTAGFLQVNPLMTKAEAEEQNPYRIGKIGSYELFVDLFAEPNEHYAIVGYQGSNEGDGDAGIIFAPYSNTVHQTLDNEFKENLFFLNRYAMVRHPQDVGNKNQANIWDAANANNSDFFKMLLIDYGTAIPNLTDAAVHFIVGNFE